MFVILYYDVNKKRVSKMLKTCRKYLTWVQNSVFEGEISISNLERLKIELENIIKDEDSVVIYTFKQMFYSKREVLGKDKKEETKFI
ncbi:CRISPR-associated protein Cas2 [Thermosipho melanesiensis]|uniref:CRISPR-associated endoribonuclease Cas2 n=2 Tax=Thermosipho melanesiensis TaxID=46541 RepID=A6LJW6_THEM4|nr:CRISPR-associated endonuclease Cas2 [Thermosipho melanesiensis]ABR30217.1 CRISPR-associated protein Cas2 [Thermosipho melanesiensis BI429]APT73413.1 CRISPR-associated protein Cas2 [Thermosipho melanesiensis]OOC37351.1 CRISPR-associated protein Cas2 [Thermosipho melanesiensis]OOC39713.1 CRISPR-associated protein Cas2 [Thermosipho melanesiensis]OOC39818.1 CRISPR-associated protein Cas2 [Thermosipho melanesiensis]